MLIDGSITTFDRIALPPMPPGSQGVVLDLVAIDAVGTTRTRHSDGAAPRPTAKLSIDALSHDLGSDSLSSLELAATIEEKTGIGITEDRWAPFHTIADLLEIVRELQEHSDSEVRTKRHQMIAADHRRDPTDKSRRDAPKRDGDCSSTAGGSSTSHRSIYSGSICIPMSSRASSRC